MGKGLRDRYVVIQERKSGQDINNVENNSQFVNYSSSVGLFVQINRAVGMRKQETLVLRRLYHVYIYGAVKLFVRIAGLCCLFNTVRVRFLCTIQDAQSSPTSSIILAAQPRNFSPRRRCTVAAKV